MTKENLKKKRKMCLSCTVFHVCEIFLSFSSNHPSHVVSDCSMYLFAKPRFVLYFAMTAAPWCVKVEYRTKNSLPWDWCNVVKYGFKKGGKEKR